VPFESQWSRIPLVARWALCLLLGAVVIVLLVAFVSHNNGNGEATLSKAKLKQEYSKDTILVHQEQAPHVVRVDSAAGAPAALAAGVGRVMHRQVTANILPGPVQHVRCWENARKGSRVAFHCSAKAADISYPFLAVYTPSTHRAVFCKKVYAPVASEDIPVSGRCRL
jgi:predicted GNAT superfamily acetyltransferase